MAGACDLGAARAQLIFAVAPFVGAVVAWSVLGEPVTLAQGVGLVLAAVGVADDRSGSQDVAVPAEEYRVRPIGWVRSPLVDLAAAPRQGDEGAPDAQLVFVDECVEGLEGLHAGDSIFVLTWLDRARRDVLSVHPRDDTGSLQQGVFSTRSADRPNPVGLHRVEVTSVDGSNVTVRNLEAIDGTPIIDVKPMLGPASER